MPVSNGRSGQCEAVGASAYRASREGSLTAEIFVFPGIIGLMSTECTDINIGAIKTLTSVQ